MIYSKKKSRQKLYEVFLCELANTKKVHIVIALDTLLKVIRALKRERK